MVNNNTMDLGMGGETGLENTTWWKPDGTDHFTVRELLMSPEGFSVRTTDGRLLSADVMEQYIQSDTPITGHEHDQQAPQINPRQLEGIDKAAIVTDEIEKPKSFGSLKYSHPGAKFQQPARQGMVRKEADPLNDPLDAQREMETPEELDAVSYGMIDRVLGKANFEDLVAVTVNPIEKIDEGVVTLVNTLNIKRSELKTYMIGRLVEKFESMVNAAFSVYFDNLLGEEVNEVEETKDSEEAPTE